MKKRRVYIFLLMLAAVLLFCFAASAEAGDRNEAEWTVLFYLCGSDLESKHGYATGNLEEIADTYSFSAIQSLYESYADAPFSDEELAQKQVNVVLETGGCREWHAQSLGMEVDAGVLQRWHYQCDVVLPQDGDVYYHLDETLPLASMADPATLTDFIRWAAERYPARKYALVLWGHGGGSKTGIFIDELFDGDVMQLDELHTALANGGASFELVLFDACMMANLETACAIRDNARWMVASEEVAAGKGTAVGDWLQQLCQTPQWGGEWLGRWICDMTQIKYANEADKQSQDLLTWSLIDLSKIDRVANAFDRFFERCCEAFVNDLDRLNGFAYYLRNSHEFGAGTDNMIDLSDVFYQEMAGATIGLDLYTEMMDALMDAVVYCVRGGGRSVSRGLSFCYAADFSAGELEIYARNCPSAHYLALLDAITPAWTAPDWVYGLVSPLPGISELDVYNVTLEKKFTADGIPAVEIVSDPENICGIYMNIYRLNEETGNTVRFGSVKTVSAINKETYEVIHYAARPCMWLAVEGTACAAELVGFDIRNNFLFNIPIQIGADNWILRCGYESATGKSEIYGLWEGYDDDNAMFDRNVSSLAQLAGQEFTLLYPIDGTETAGRQLYETSTPLTVYRSLEIEVAPLPAGTVWLEYWVEDIFQRHLTLERVEMLWDGQQLSLAPGADWEGTVTLVAPEK